MTIDRRAMAVLAGAGPLAVAVLRAILPYDSADAPAAVVAKVADHPGTEGVVLWLSLVAIVLLVPGTIAVGLRAIRRRPVLGTVGLAITLAGFGALPMVAVTDAIALSGVRAGLPAGVTERLLDAAQRQPAIAAAGIVFVVGHILGVVLLGICLWRAGVLPGWAGFVLAVSQPLHLVFAVVVVNHPLDGCAWALTGLGFALAVATAGSPRSTGPGAVPAVPSRAR